MQDSSPFLLSLEQGSSRGSGTPPGGGGNVGLGLLCVLTECFSKR